MNETLLAEIDVRTHRGGLTNSPVVNSLIWLGALGLICYLLWWLIGYLALPAPFDKVARAIVGVRRRHWADRDNPESDGYALVKSKAPGCAPGAAVVGLVTPLPPALRAGLLHCCRWSRSQSPLGVS